METRVNIFTKSSAENNLPFESFEQGVYTDYLQILKNELDRLTDLPSNWDGYGGVPVLEDIAIKAKHFLCLLNDTFIDSITDVFPNQNGTVTIEWEFNIKEKLSLEIGKDNYSYFVEIDGETPKFYNGNGLPDLATFSSHLAEVSKNEPPRIYVFS